MRRLDPLPLLAVRRRIAGTRLDANGEGHFLYGREQITLHIDSQRLQRRDIEGVQALLEPRLFRGGVGAGAVRLAFRDPFVLSLSKDGLRTLPFDGLRANGVFCSLRIDQVTQRRQKPRQRLTRPGGRHQQSMPPLASRIEHLQLMPPGFPPARREPISDNRGDKFKLFSVHSV